MKVRSETTLVKDGRFPLGRAISSGDVNAVKELLHAGTDPDAPSTGQGLLPLELALCHENTDIVEALLAGGASVNRTNRYGRTALYQVYDDESARLLLEAGANPNVRDVDGDTPLHWTASTRGGSGSVRALIDAGANVNARNGDGQTPLFGTQRRGVAAALLDAGGHTDVRDGESKTALHMLSYVFGYTGGLHEDAIAEKCDPVGVVTALLDAGADVNAQDEDGKSALHHAVTHDHWMEILDELADQMLQVVRLLGDAGADVNAVDRESRTPMHWAVWCDGACPVVRELIGLGADVNRQDIWGFTPLHLALAPGLHLSVMPERFAEQAGRVTTLLMEAGCDLRLRDYKGRTALHFAARFGGPDVVEMLLQRGADTQVRDAYGRTALDLGQDVVCCSPLG